MAAPSPNPLSAPARRSGGRCAESGLDWAFAPSARPRPRFAPARELLNAKAEPNLGTDFWTHRVELAAEAASVSEARLFVRARLRDHGLAAIEGDVQLVVSELATNALTHAGTPFVVTVHRDELTLFLTVRDGSPVHPAVVKVEAMAPGGRGISIVDALSQAWGSVDQPGAAKSVWASFALPASP